MSITRRRFLQGVVRENADSSLPDVEWIGTDGKPMGDEDWDEPENKCLVVFLNGSAIPESTSRGERIIDDSALIMFNASGNPVDFTLPDTEHGRVWTVVLGTGKTIDVGAEVSAQETISRPAHSLLVLMRPAGPGPGEDVDEEAEQPARA